VVSFTPQPVSLDRRLAGPQCRSGRCGEDTNFLPLLEIDPQLSNQSLYRAINKEKWACAVREKVKQADIQAVIRYYETKLLIIIYFIIGWGYFSNETDYL
jgi:hypothetical protein